MTTHQDLVRGAGKAAKLLTKENVSPISFTATDDTSVKGWSACTLATTTPEQQRRIVILSEQGDLHLLIETRSTTTIEKILPEKAAQITGQSLVALYMRIDALLADVEREN